MSAPARKNARWTAMISPGASIRSRADHNASERSCPRDSSAVARPPSVIRTALSPRKSVLVDFNPIQLGQRLEGHLVALVDRDLQVRARFVDPTFVEEEAAEGEGPPRLGEPLGLPELALRGHRVAADADQELPVRGVRPQRSELPRPPVQLVGVGVTALLHP